MRPSDELRARVLAAASQTPSPTRKVRRGRELVIGSVVAASSSFLFVSKGGFDLLEGNHPQVFAIGTAAGWIAIAALCLWIAFGRRRSMLGWPRAWLIAAALGAPVALALWTIVWAKLYPATTATCPPYISPIGNRCREIALSVTAVPLLALMIARRTTVPLHPAATGASFGAAIGAVAGVLIDLQCGCSAPLHVLVGHVLPVALLAAAGALGGHWLLAFRATERGD